MAKPKNTSPQAVRNRNNRKRGGAFEKRVADILDMHVVPYSGSNSRFGWSDVRDSEQKDRAIWMGECKNISLKADDTAVTIKREWLAKNDERSDSSKAMPFLAFMISGKPQKYIMVDEDVFKILLLEQGHKDGETKANRILELRKKTHNVVNIIIPLDELKVAYQYNERGLLQIRNEGDTVWYYIFSIDAFDSVLYRTGLHCKYVEERGTVW